MFFSILFLPYVFNAFPLYFQQTYGFIQCCERQARLFFHFSQFDGNTEHLRIGDPVEFEVTFDRRTGKPIASAVTKISPEVVRLCMGIFMHMYRCLFGVTDLAFCLFV